MRAQADQVLIPDFRLDRMRNLLQPQPAIRTLPSELVREGKP